MKRSGWLTLAAIAWSVVQNYPIAIAQQAPPTQTAPPNGAAGIQTSAVVYTPPGFSNVILAQGRRIYRDLSHALSAVYQHDAIELRLTLTDAQRRLAQLYGGPDADALQAQMEIIRDDVGPGHKSLDKGLWVPLQAEVEHFLLRAPEPVRTAARSTVEKGRAAAERGERRAARKQLEVLLEVLQYQVQVFPLAPVRGDVESAITSGFLATPDWEATRQALESALSQVRWLAREQADGLLDAYYQVANAYGAWPDTKQVAGDLKQAANDLIAVPEAPALAQELKRAARNPTRKGLADLLSRLRERIQFKQRRNSSAVHEKPSPLARIGKPPHF